MAYDPKCFELAEHFLPSTARDELKNALAQEIQTQIEGWLEHEAKRLCYELGIDPSHLEQA